MNRPKLNPIVDLALAVAVIGMILSGFILRFPFSQASDRNVSLWGLSRHQWGQAHFWLAVGLLMILLVHVILHWKWIEATLRKRFGFGGAPEGSGSSMGLWASLFAIVFLATLLWSAWAGKSPVAVDADTGSSPGLEEKKIQSWRPLTYLEDIRPLLRAKCLGCHGPDRQSGGFRIDEDAPFQQNPAREPLIVAGYPDSSGLVKILSGAYRNGHPGEFHHISVGELLRIARWIEDGAGIQSTNSIR